MDEVAISFTIKPTWSIVKEVKEKASEFIETKNISREVTEATLMCSSELIENAIKYGTEKPGGDNIVFDLTTDEQKIRIMVSNGVKDSSDVKNVSEHINKIKNSDDPAKLYTERLMELMENPKPGISQLGLYRIAYEGEFKLDYEFKDSVLTIFAERPIN